MCSTLTRLKVSIWYNYFYPRTQPEILELVFKDSSPGSSKDNQSSPLLAFIPFPDSHQSI